MADTTITFTDTRESYRAIKAVDLGDNTFALATAAVTSRPALDVLDRQEKAVSTSPLRVNGATNWTGANPNDDKNRQINLANTSPTLRIYVKLIEDEDALAGIVSSTSFDTVLEPLDSATFYVPAGYDLAVVRSSVSTDVVRAVEASA